MAWTQGRFPKSPTTIPLIDTAMPFPDRSSMANQTTMNELNADGR